MMQATAQIVSEDVTTMAISLDTICKHGKQFLVLSIVSGSVQCSAHQNQQIEFPFFYTMQHC